MILSEDKISSLSHLVLDCLIEKKWAVLREEETRILREIRKVITAELRIQEEIDSLVRHKLSTYSKRLIEGTPEWEVLYKKFLLEERSKRHR